MNKVVNIALSGQIFWIDETAYKALQHYLLKLKEQLHGRASAGDIYADIEHYLCELFFAISNNGKNTITEQNISAVIEQVGFLDNDDLEEEPEPQSRFAPDVKILGGVCAGLANRLSLPVLFVRGVFILLTAAFGVGLFIYVVLLLSLNDSAKRDSFLMAQGKTPTAKLIATVEMPTLKRNGLLSTVIFFPFIASAKLFSFVKQHYNKYRVFYTRTVKTFILGLLITINLVLINYLFNFSERRLFELPFNMLMILSVGILATSVTAMVVQRYLLTYPSVKHKKVIASGILIPVCILICGSLYLENVNSYERIEKIEKTYTIAGHELQVIFENDETEQQFIGQNIKLMLRATGPQGNGQQENRPQQNVIGVTVDYFSRGSDPENALQNIHGISYLFKVVDNKIILGNQFSLHQDALYRGQAISVTLSIPQGISLNLPDSLNIQSDAEGYYYRLNDSVGKNAEIPSDQAQKPNRNYISGEGYFHEVGFLQGVSPGDNEFLVLKEKFCQTFFVGELWQCKSSIDTPAQNNRLLSPLFYSQVNMVESVRASLNEQLVMNKKKLLGMRTSLEKISGLGSGDTPLNRYLDHLINYKSSYAM